jgi:hypothetical protein
MTMANSNAISAVSLPSVAVTRRPPAATVERHPLVAVGLGILAGYLIARLAGR